MRTEVVHFFSHGAKLRGILRTPDSAGSAPLATVVQGPGWLGLAEGNVYKRWHEGFCAAGYAVLCFDYRGFGESEGEPGWILPDQQTEDLRNAITYVQTRSDLDPERIALYSMGGLGTANALAVAATDERVRALACQNVVADGLAWFRSMRRQHEWITYLRRVEEDRKRCVLGEPGEMVDPRADLMVATPERLATTAKKDVDARIAKLFHLQSATALLRHRPIEIVDRIAPRALLLTSISDDVVCPNEQADLVYARAGAPKKHIRMHGTTHYGQADSYHHVVMPHLVDWFDRYVRSGAVETSEQTLHGRRRQLIDKAGGVTFSEESG